MLQQIRDRLTGWVALAILGVIGLSFVVVGGANFALTGDNYAAKVDGVAIGIGQFEAAYREQLQENPQFAALPQEYRLQLRTNILEQLIQQRVLDNYLDDAGYQVGDDQIAKLVQQQPEFQVDGKFDLETYRNVLTQYGFEPATFEQSQRATMRRSQLQRAIGGSSLVAPSGYRRFLNLAYEQRLVRTASIETEAVADEVSVTDEMISAYYDDNPGLYQIAESADVEYVEISRDDVIADVEISEEQLTDYYASNQDRFLQDEQRQARHILIPFGDDEAAAEIQANEILARIRAGEPFADLARTYSKDGGTAAAGGDLGTLTQSQLPGELGSAVFSLEEGATADLVKSDFGIHIVRLDEIFETGPLPFDRVRETLKSELQEQDAEGLFLALERKLSDALFDATDIQGIANAVSGQVKTVAGFSRNGGDPFAESQLAIDTIFDPTVLSGAQLSEVIELDANRTVVFSVTNHNQAKRKPLADVNDQIAASLSAGQAEELMAARAQRMVDALAAGDDFATAAAAINAPTSGPAVMTRDAQEMDQALTASVFTSLKPTQGKSTTGSTRNSAGGYTVFSVDAVLPGQPERIPLADRDAGKKQLVEQYGIGDFVAFVQALRNNAEVVINSDALAAQDLFQ